MRQMQFHPTDLFLISSILVLGCALAACSYPNGDTVNRPTRPDQTSPMVLTATPILSQPTHLPFDPRLPASTSIPETPALAWPYNLPELDGEPLFSQFSTLLSPNGQWLVNAWELVRDPSVMQIISTSDPSVILTCRPIYEGGVSPGSGVISWSPDSRTVVVESASEPAPCGYDRVTIYQITDQPDLTYAIYYLPDDEQGCVQVTWSPDSSQLALYYASEKVTILDRQGEIIQHLTIPIRWKLFWTKRGVIAEVRQEYGQPVHTELRRYDLAAPDHYQTLLVRDEYILVMGFDEQFQRALVASSPRPPTAEERTYQLQVYDLETGEGQLIASLRGNIWYDNVAIVPPNMLAFILDPQNGEPKHLMVFNWSWMDLTDYGELAFLVGWRPNVEGLLIVQSNEMNDYWIEVVPIRP